MPNFDLFLYFLLPALLTEPEKPKEEPKDEFENYPIGYLSDMYRVQVDITAEHADEEWDPFSVKYIRENSDEIVKANKRKFDKAEEAIQNLLLTVGENPVQRECMVNALKDYCDHLSDLFDTKMKS